MVLMKRAILFETPADETILNAYGESVVSFHTLTASHLYSETLLCVSLYTCRVERNNEMNKKLNREDRYALVPSSVRCSVSQA